MDGWGEVSDDDQGYGGTRAPAVEQSDESDGDFDDFDDAVSSRADRSRLVHTHY